jgi:perosamine synthetase
MINTYIPYLKNNEKSFLLNCLKSSFISTAGPKVGEFEKLFSKKYKFKYSVAVNSGTSAIHLALLSLGVVADDIVIVPTYTFAATANAVRYTGASPWFFDCDKDLVLDLDKLEISLKKQTILKSNKLIDKDTGKVIKAIIPVQTFGKAINFFKYEKFANKYSLKIIFDSAACHDPRIMNFKKKPASLFCFSFNGNKTLTTGAGGILATNSKLLADKARLFSTVGKKKSNYDYQVIGYNYKMTSIQASLGLSQLDNLDHILNKKKTIFKYYEKKLNRSNNYNIIFDKKNVNWVFVLVLNKSKKFKIIKENLNKEGIQLDYFWKPLHLQKPYKNFRCANVKFSNDIWKKIIILPSHPNITRNNQDRVCKILSKII